MKVQCDKCGAKFNLPDEKVKGKQTKVRCSKCKAVFIVNRTEDAESAEPAAPPATAAKTAPEKKPSPPAAAKPAPPAKPPAKSETPPPRPAAAPAKPGAKPKPGGKGDEDPFADFNFTEDVDFEAEEGGAPAKPAAPPPPAPLPGPPFQPKGPLPPPKPAPAPAPPDDDGFVFSDDEDFSANANANADAGTGPGSAPKGDFDFSDEDFSGAPAAEPPAPGNKSDSVGEFNFEDRPLPDVSPPAPHADDGDWGNVSFSEPKSRPAPAKLPGPAAKPGARDDIIDDTEFGDFKFDADDHIPASATEEGTPEPGAEVGRGPAAKPKPKPKPKPPAHDELEANIGDTETPSEPEKEVKPRKEAPPAAAKPAPKPPAKGGSKVVGLIVGFIIVAGLAAVGVVFKDKIVELPGLNTLFGEKPIDLPKGDVEIVSDPKSHEPIFSKKLYDREEDAFHAGPESKLLVVTGEVVNKTLEPVNGIQVGVTVTDGEGKPLLEGFSYCGATFTDEQLQDEQELSQGDIETLSGLDNKCLDVGRNEKRPFMIVFFKFNLEEGKYLLKPPRVVSPASE